MGPWVLINAGWYKMFHGVSSFRRLQATFLRVSQPGAYASFPILHQPCDTTQGTARVTRGDEILDLNVNQSTYIPTGVKHRLENLGSEPLRVIEVQSGDYLGEDDIVRFDDVYGRAEDGS